MGDGLSKSDDNCNSGQSGLSVFAPLFGLGRRPSDTLIIFDWDDTLLCSSAVNVQQCDQGQLQQLEIAVEAVLNVAVNLGDTCIVTNGIKSWVQESSRCYLPKVVPLLSRLSIKSARDSYEQSFPGDPFAWKKAAFAEILASRRGNAGLSPGGVNLIVLGDSLAEIEAAQMALSLRGPSVIKTVKFKEMPSVSELLGQLRVVTQLLANIVNEDRSQSKALVPRSLPPHLAYLTSWASGWRIADHRPGVQLDVSSNSPLTFPAQSFGSVPFTQAAYGAGYGPAAGLA